MSQRAVTLLETFYNRPLPDYRAAIWEIRQWGGLDPDEKALIQERAAAPTDAQMILRQTDPHGTVFDKPSE